MKICGKYLIKDKRPQVFGNCYILLGDQCFFRSFEISWSALLCAETPDYGSQAGSWDASHR